MDVETPLNICLHVNTFGHSPLIRPVNENNGKEKKGLHQQGSHYVWPLRTAEAFHRRKINDWSIVLIFTFQSASRFSIKWKDVMNDSNVNEKNDIMCHS